MSIFFSKESKKFFKKIPLELGSHIISKVENLDTKDFESTNIKPMKGRIKGLYRLRIGGVRVIYSLEKDDVYVHKINFRGNIY